MGLLDNKTAIVTGSSRGIGAEVAKFLAAEGAAVVVNYRQKAPRANKVVAEIEAAGGRAAAVGADLTTQEGVQALASAAMENFGSLDLLVLNASGGMESGMEEGYALKLNRDAQVNMLNAAVPLMPEGSRVVFVTSHQAHFIETVPTMPEYEPVARSKRAGEDALRELVPEPRRQGHLPGRGLRRHDRRHRHRHAAGPLQPGRHRGPPRRGRQAVLGQGIRRRGRQDGHRRRRDRPHRIRRRRRLLRQGDGAGSN